MKSLKETIKDAEKFIKTPETKEEKRSEKKVEKKTDNKKK